MTETIEIDVPESHADRWEELREEVDGDIEGGMVNQVCTIIDETYRAHMVNPE